MNVRQVGGFTWDAINIEKLSDHGLEPQDVEALFDDDPAVFRHPTHPNRWLALGFVPDERFVLVSFELDEPTHWVRVVTAFEPTATDGGGCMRRSKKSTRKPTKRGKSTDEQLVEAQWSDVDLQQLQPVSLELDPALRERIRSDRLQQLTLRVGQEQIDEAKWVARQTNKKYQAVMRQWLAEGASKARAQRLKHGERTGQRRS